MKFHSVNFFIFSGLLISTCVLVLFSPVNKLFHVNNCSILISETNEVVKEVNVAEKLVAITFDDGPGPLFTNKILDLLKSYHAKATFFVIAEQAEKLPEIISREINEGHEIGNHMYHHREVYHMPLLELNEDLKHSDQSIHRIIGKKTTLYRPTSGFYNDEIIRIAGNFNYRVILWNLDSRDWTGRNGGIIAVKILKEIKPGSIILFHDFGGNRRNTITALEILLPELAGRGYRFVTITELLGKSIKSNK